MDIIFVPVKTLMVRPAPRHGGQGSETCYQQRLSRIPKHVICNSQPVSYIVYPESLILHLVFFILYCVSCILDHESCLRAESGFSLRSNMHGASINQ